MIYAIHRATKEHRALLTHRDHAAINSNMEWRIIDADADGWIEWHGGECPLPSDQLCEVKLRPGSRNERPKRTADEWVWAHILPSSDIIAYRPVLEPQAPEWDGEGLPPEGTVCEYQSNRHCPWKRVEVTAIGREKILMWDCTTDRENHLLLKGLGHFRPLRTDREQWIDEVSDALRQSKITGNATAIRAAEYFYDAMVSGNLPLPKTPGGKDA